MNTVMLLLCLCTPAETVAAPDTPLARYRDFALKTAGDPERGRAVFERENVGCIKCHTVAERPRRAGPDLARIGDKYQRAGMVQAVLEPSAAILTGYAPTTFLTRDGKVHTGILERRDPELLEVLLADGGRISIPRREVVQETVLETSLMPAELHKVMTREEFVDLVAYLGTLRQAAGDGGTYEGRGFGRVPAEISAVAKPIRIESLHGEEHSFTRPVGMHVMPGTVDRFAVVQHNPAQVWMLEKGLGGDRKWLFVDLGAEARLSSDTGIVGFVFHPDFERNGRYFVYHHTDEELPSGAPLGVILVERRASDDRRRDSGAPSRRLLHVGRWTVSHTGGAMGFGTDGMLYLAIGDGGPQRDIEGNGQNLRTLLGSIVRIDVGGRSSGLPYAIPASNPLVGHPDPLVREEIWAWGFRQPWRFSFDEATGDLWVGEVGQDRFEEIMIVRRGENHGWNVYEAHVPFSDKYRQAGAIYTPPVLSVRRQFGVSVTGGFVYRGDASPTYRGVYIFGDYESRRIWGMVQHDRRLVAIREIGRSPDRIVAFGKDPAGELYIVGYNTGRIFRIHLEDSVFDVVPEQVSGDR